MLKVAHVLRLVFALSTITILIFWVALSSSVKDRYQNHPASYYKTFLQEGPIDLIALGSSRAARLAGPLELKAGLEQEMQQGNIVVYSYAKGGRDLIVDYVYLRDYLKEHCVGTVLAEINQSHPSRYHMSFDYVAPHTIIWDTYLNDSYYAWPRRVQLALRSSLNKMFKSIYRRHEGDYNVFNRPVEPVRTKNRPSKKNVAVVRPRHIDKNYWDLTQPFENRQSRYIFKILKEAEKYGTKVIFYYPPTSESVPLSPKFTEDFRQMFGQPIYQLNQMQLDDMRSTRAYADYNHVNQVGRDYLINWMVNSFDIQLSNQAKCAVE